VGIKFKMADETPLESPMPKRDAADGCSFDFDLEAEQALLDDLDWDEYNNPINDLSLDFDSTLSSPTEWVQDPTEW